MVQGVRRGSTQGRGPTQGAQIVLPLTLVRAPAGPSGLCWVELVRQRGRVQPDDP